jgi:carboxyl-terminal processing protease
MARGIAALACVLVLLGALVAAGAPAEKPAAPKEDYYELYRILVDTMDQVERNYVKEVGRRELIEAAIEGVLDKLDPYSAYISPEEVTRFKTTVENEFSGIGIQLASDRRQLTIFSPLVGSPAYRAGLLAGDRIVEIEDQSTEGMRIEEAVSRLKGAPGSEVKLTVIHPGRRDRVEVTLTRQQIHVDTVLGDRRKEDDSWDYMLRPEEKIGYVRLSAFSRDTARELRTVLEQLQSDGMRGLILDLRFNPGGLLTSAIEVSDMFISEGRIVSTEGRNSPERVWDAKKEGTFEGFPMAVLVNRYTASASEIVAACLQDHKRAEIIGDRTWGKGSVQNVIELEDGKSLLKLTTASYRRPSGKEIHRFEDSSDQQEWGVTPEEPFRLRLSNAEMEQLLQDRRQRDVVRSNHNGTGQAEQPEQQTDQPKGNPAQPEDELNSHPEDDDVDQPEEEPAEEPGGQEEPETEQAPQQPPQQPSQGADQGAPAQDEAVRQPGGPAFVDRQVQMAVDYLIGELARAE